MKKYTLTHLDTGWEMVVGIDETNPSSAQTIKQTVEFWSGFESRLMRNDGDYTQTFLTMLSGAAAKLSVACGGLGVNEVIRAMSRQEGWPRLDGGDGITLIDCEVFSISDEDFRVKEVS